MPGVLPDIFSLDDICEDDIFVSPSADELGVIFADVERVDIVVMNIFVLFDHHIFGWIVETDRTVL